MTAGIGAGYDMLAIGRPYTDMIAKVDDSLVEASGFPKGEITEITPRQMLELRPWVTSYDVFPGGSPSNTVAGISALGGKAAFFGKVCNDTGGRAFRAAFKEIGVQFPTVDHPAGHDAISATCMVLVTPDGKGTVLHCAGVSDELNEDDIFPDIVAASRILYFQAHLLFAPQGVAAITKAERVAIAARRQVFISLHDHRMTRNQAEIFKTEHMPAADGVIGNLGEFQSLFGSTDLEPFRRGRTLMIMTDGPAGVHLAGRDELLHVPPYKLHQKPNTVGAGDQFFAGFSKGYLDGNTLERCCEFGGETASAIIEMTGARPIGSWAHIAEKYRTLQRGPAIGSGSVPVPS